MNKGHYDPYKRLAAAVIRRAVLDARGQVHPPIKRGSFRAERMQREAQKFLQGSMLPWSEMLDIDSEKLHKVGRNFAEKRKPKL